MKSAQGSAVLLPEGKSKTKRPALILLPFTGGSAHDLYERWYRDSLAGQAQHRGFIVVLPSPRGSAQDYSTGPAWTETLNRYRRNVAADARELVSRFDADPNRIALAGYSMGGDLGWALIQRDPELYSGAIVMGSRATYRDKGLGQFAKRGGRVFVFMGNGEDEARKAGARSAMEAMKRAGVSLRYKSAEGGHVPAPARIFKEAADFVLGYSEGQTSPPARAGAAPGGGPVATPAWATAARVTSNPILERLPSCSWKLFEDPKSERRGFKDQAGKIIVPAKYIHAEEFGPDGLAQILKDGRWGYLTCGGKEFYVTTLDHSPDPFSDGLARFEESGRTGFLNRRGEKVFPAQFERAAPFCGGIAQIGRSCRSSMMGEHKLTECEEEYYIDTSGRAVPTPANPRRWPDCDAASASMAEEPESHAAVRGRKAISSGEIAGCDWEPFSDSSGLFGYRKGSGDVLVKPRFTEAREFDADLGLAQAREGKRDVGYLTCEGNFFRIYNNGSWYDKGWDDFHEGLVRIDNTNGLIGYANLKGQVVIKPQYEYGTPFCGGKATVGTSCSVLKRNARGMVIKASCRWRSVDRFGHESEWHTDPDKVPRQPEESGEDECETILDPPSYDHEAAYLIQRGIDPDIPGFEDESEEAGEEEESEEEGESEE